MTRIHHPISPEVVDQTGLTLCGRHKDGRFLYRSISVWHDCNVVALTHEERVGLAVSLAFAKQAVSRTPVIYPMTRRGRYQGWGRIGGSTLWLQRPLLGNLGRSFLGGEKPTLKNQCLAVLAHELGHNTQPMRSKPHGPEFDKAHVNMRVALAKAIHRGWPKLDMRKLRDKQAPHLAKSAAKKRRRVAAAGETRVAKWTRTLAAAEKLLASWKKRLASAERKVATWEKKVKHAQTCLDRAVGDERSGA